MFIENRDFAMVTCITLYKIHVMDYLKKLDAHHKIIFINFYFHSRINLIGLFFQIIECNKNRDKFFAINIK